MSDGFAIYLVVLIVLFVWAASSRFDALERKIEELRADIRSLEACTYERRKLADGTYVTIISPR